MTIRHQIELETISFVAIAVFVGSFFVWRGNQNFQNRLRAASPVVIGGNTQKIIVPSVNPIQKIETSSQISPDGTKQLVMKKSRNSDGTSTFVFTATDGSGANGRQLYTANAPGTENFAIPFNTWSPDNRYVFIQKNTGDALVFQATGEPFKGGQAYFDVKEIFTGKIKNAVPGEVTGWASPSLLIVNTVKDDSAKWSSYWFEVPSTAVIPLSSQF